MTKKMIILNASPRKNRNTATLLKEAQHGAEAATPSATRTTAAPTSACR